MFSTLFVPPPLEEMLQPEYPQLVSAICDARELSFSGEDYGRCTGLLSGPEPKDAGHERRGRK
jgi:hypothetical protein